MSRDKQIDLIKKELLSLEDDARRDSKLKLPTLEENNAFFEEKVQGIFSDDPKYWEKEKRPNRSFGYDDPQYIKDLKDIRLRQKQRLESRTERSAQNELKYFSKAQEAASMVKMGVDYANAGNYEDAIAAFKTAYKEAPNEELVSGSDRSGSWGQFSAALCFNLGKVYFESGDVEQGLLYLTRYCDKQNKGNYHKETLDKFLSLEYKNVSVNGKTQQVLKAGSLNGKKFKVSKSKVKFDKKVVKLQDSQLGLPYKIPVDLELELRDKEEITLLDYQYLIEVDYQSSGCYFYEILLPLHKFSVFMEEFYGTLVEYKVKMKPLNDFNTLYTELFVAKKLLESLKYYEDQEIDSLNEFKSIALIEVPLEDKDRVLDDYKKFLSFYVLEQKGGEELIQGEILKVKKEFDYEEQVGLIQLYGEFEAAYQHHLKVMEEYAQHSVHLHNLENEIAEPFKTENEKVYSKAKSYYWSLLNGAFSMYEKKSGEMEEPVAFSVLKFQNQMFKQYITNQWKVTNELLVIDPPSALQRSRILIEALMNEIFKIKNYSFRDKDGFELDLKGKYDRIDWALNHDIRQKLDKLRFKGNACSHYADIKEIYFGHLQDITRDQAEIYVSYLEEVITYLVRKFHL